MLQEKEDYLAQFIITSLYGIMDGSFGLYGRILSVFFK